jgi:hypothetical protein
MTNGKKMPYEPPVIIDLSGNTAHAQTTEDLIRQCNSGSAITGINCRSGGSPASQCYAGSTATSGECKAGSVATDKCKTGTTAASSECRTGFLASSGCKTGVMGY